MQNDIDIVKQTWLDQMEDVDWNALLQEDFEAEWYAEQKHTDLHEEIFP